MEKKINNNTKAHAINLAKDYLQGHGFNGFSFQTIADALGIKKASLHYYFSSKEEMALALIDDYEKGHLEWTKKIAYLSSREKLEKMIKGFCSLSSKNYKICPIGAFVSDYSVVTPKVQERIKKFHFMVRDFVMETLEQGIKEGSITKAIDPKICADLFLTSLHGGVQVARVRGEQESLEKMLGVILDQYYGK